MNFNYIQNYSLDVESQASLLNIDTLSVGEIKCTAIDLVETFNYLLGLLVEKIKQVMS